jgi:hypothetical protein
MPVMQVSGTKQLGADLHQWHAGMDAIYAVGSQFYAARSVDISDAQDALRLLEQEHRNRKATKLSRSAVAQLNAVIRNLRHRIDAASARPNPGSCSMRRANPSKPKARTYAVARAEILRALQQEGWDVRANLKMPHATHPRGGFRLWFKTQAIYESHGSETSSFAGAHSLWIGDIRTMPVEDVLAYIERVRKSS